NAQTPARDVDFVNSLVADFTVAGVPDPMPVIVKAIARERLQRRGAGPKIVIDAGGNGVLGGPPDRGAPLVENATSHVDIADCAISQVLDGFEHAGICARLAAALANAIVLFHRADQ